jgi:hypothetical protein
LRAAHTDAKLRDIHFDGVALLAPEQESLAVVLVFGRQALQVDDLCHATHHL